MGEVILVASGKGGTGKTMFSVNMGAMLSRYGYRVMLIDMDMGLRNMDLYLGMEDRVIYNLMDGPHWNVQDQQSHDQSRRL